MSGIEIVAAVAGVVTAVQGAIELTKKIQERRRKNKEAIRELSLSLFETQQDLTCQCNLLNRQYGHQWPFGSDAYHRMLDVKSQAQAIHMFLQFVFNNREDIKDPREYRQRIDKARWTAMDILSRPQLQPPTVPLIGTEVIMPSQHAMLAEGPTAASDIPLAHAAEVPRTEESIGIGLDQVDWFPGWSMNGPGGNTMPANTDVRRQLSVASVQSGIDNRAGPSPTPTDPPKLDKRVSIGSQNTTSSGSSGTSTPSRRRLWSISGRSATETTFISNHSPGVIKGIPSRQNSWYGFCQGAWEIADTMTAIEVRQRPVGNYSTECFLQCKRCHFRGRLQPGTNPKLKIPHRAVFTASCGIRFRWAFLAKCHEKDSVSSFPDKSIQEQASGAKYRCPFCFLDHETPPRLGNVETLMNHIYQHHRSQSMNPKHLSRLNCILGELASDAIEFDINIPESLEAEIETAGYAPDDVAELAGQAARLGLGISGREELEVYEDARSSVIV